MATISDAERQSAVRQWGKTLLQRVRETLPNSPNEADFRQAVDPLLHDFCHAVQADALPHAEYTLATGRADAVFNRLVIEYEAPGVLKPSLTNQATSHAVAQVKAYIQGVSDKEHHQLRRLAGVAFDGYYLVFVRFLDEAWSVEAPMAVNAASL